MTQTQARATSLKTIWEAAIDAVSGYQSVVNALENDSAFKPDQVLAVGKAAAGMCLGVIAGFGSQGYEFAVDALLRRIPEATGGSKA